MVTTCAPRPEGANDIGRHGTVVEDGLSPTDEPWGLRSQAPGGTRAPVGVVLRPLLPHRRRRTDLPLPRRYEVIDRIASGSFGDVWRVRDGVLDRVLAMKVLRGEMGEHQHVRARFLTEARITAGLQHPGIVAVHDQGELADGRLWITMKEVRGRTLGAVIGEVHRASSPEGFQEAPSGWSFRRLVDAFARISQAVAYAHSRGVMHRDLKPENLMVGEFGEVQVMDWGLARRVGLLEDNSYDFGAEISYELPADLTRHGDILGTPAYMPPEQAKGEREKHGTHSDVYSLGAILYHLLSGRPPFTGSSDGVLRQLIQGPPRPLREVLEGGPPVPPELVSLCERAMQREISDRYPNAEPIAAEVVAFLEGARRREQALAVLAEARAIEPHITALRTRAAEQRERAQALLAQLAPFDPIEKKREGWALEDAARDLVREAALRETAWLQAVHGALSLHPDLAEGHALLADHYRERLSAAELAHDDEAAASYEAMLRAHDRGRHAAFVRGEGKLTVITDPPGATVHLERYERIDRRLVAVPLRVLGETPLRDLPLTRGSYRLRLTAPGCAEVLYPVLIERGLHWDGRGPGDADPTPILLPAEGELGANDCYVPAGWCWTGGDPQAPDSLLLRRVWIEAFVIRRHPVTNAEYAAFLNDLVERGRAEEALAACPRSQLGMGDAAGERLAFGRDAAGRYVLVDDELGRPLDPDWPVVLVDWHGAAAYAAWAAERTGFPWRLADELEREKAARGADGRLCPWGDHLEATFAQVLESQPDEPSRASVFASTFDESPYGVRGLAGNSRDWCGNVWRREGPRIERDRLVIEGPSAADPDFRAVRGGAWSSVLSCSRATARFGSRPALRRASMGIRLSRSLVKEWTG